MRVELSGGSRCKVRFLLIILAYAQQLQREAAVEEDNTQITRARSLPEAASNLTTQVQWQCMFLFASDVQPLPAFHLRSC